jgi:histidine triad (HIT) family protein
MGCVFCGMDKNRILRESEYSHTILSNPYLIFGHCLVIPKKHYESLLEMPDDSFHDLIEEVRLVEKILLESFKGFGCDIRQHYRPFQKEGRLKVNHVHFHIIPRSFEDELYKKSMVYEIEVFKELDEKMREEASELFFNGFGNLENEVKLK